MVPEAPLVLPSLRQGTTVHCVSNCTFFLYIQFYILPLPTKALAAPEAVLNSTQITNIHIKSSTNQNPSSFDYRSSDLSQWQKDLVKQDSFRQHKIIHQNSQLNNSKTSNGGHKAKKRNEALAKSKQEKCACKKKWVRLKQYWYKNGIIYCSIAETLEPVARAANKAKRNKWSWSMQ